MAVVNYGDYDAWQRHALITVESDGYAVYLQALTETIDIDIGERELDKIDLLNLGQIPKHGAIGLSTVTFEGYVLEAGSVTASATATGFWDIFAYQPTRTLNSGSDAALAEPQLQPITNELTRYRVSILWTNDGAATGGTSAVTSGATYQGKRFIIADCFCTSCKDSFTDGVLKTTLTFKGVAFNKSASARIKMESIDLATASALAAPTAYTPDTTPW